MHSDRGIYNNIHMFNNNNSGGNTYIISDINRNSDNDNHMNIVANNNIVMYNTIYISGDSANNTDKNMVNVGDNNKNNNMYIHRV